MTGCGEESGLSNSGAEGRERQVASEAVPGATEARTRIGLRKDLVGKRVGILTGTVMDQLAKVHFPDSIGVYYNSFDELVLALQLGRIDAFLSESPQFRLMQSRVPGLARLEGNLESGDYALVFPKTEADLCAAFSREIRRMKEDGTLKRLDEKWFSGDVSRKVMLPQRENPRNGVLKFATVPQFEPFTYVQNGEVVGYDIEVAQLAAAALGYSVKPVPMEWGGYLESISSGKVRFGVCCTTVTEERKQKVLFTEPNYTGEVIVVVLSGNRSEATPFEVMDALSDKRIGVMNGTRFPAYSKKLFKHAKRVSYDTCSELAQAVEQRQIEGFLLDEIAAVPLLKRWPELKAVPASEYVEDYAFVLGKERNAELREALNSFLAKSRDAGVLNELEEIWFKDAPESKRKIGELSDLTGETRGIRVAAKRQMEPFSYEKDGRPLGYDIALLARFCRAYGYGFQVDLFENSDAVLSAVVSGQYDIGVGGMAVTGDRQKTVDFSEAYARGGVAAVVRSDFDARPGAVQEGFFAGLRESFERTFLREDRWKMIAEGLGVTLIITLGAAVLGTILSFGVCWLRRSRHAWLRIPGKWYVLLVQGTPIMVTLMILYYVVFAKVNLPTVAVAILGFGLNFAAYVGEMLRTGIDAIPRGQIDAAKALGMKRFQTFRKVIFPQAARQILPVYRGEFINMLKNTSVVGFIAIQDLTKMSEIIRSRTYEAFFPLITTAILYFVIAWLFAEILSCFERRLDPKFGKRPEPGGAAR